MFPSLTAIKVLARMSTRSTIGYVREDGTVRAVYCHSDGYATGVGLVLLLCYNTRAKVEKLVRLGGLSMLAPTIGKKTSFDSRDYTQVIAYHRDRGDPLEIEDYENPSEFLSQNGHIPYMLMNGEWYTHREYDQPYWTSVRSLVNGEPVIFREKEDGLGFHVGSRWLDMPDNPPSLAEFLDFIQSEKIKVKFGGSMGDFTIHASDKDIAKIMIRF